MTLCYTKPINNVITERWLRE